jgi:hypothetical protein
MKLGALALGAAAAGALGLRSARRRPAGDRPGDHPAREDRRLEVERLTVGRLDVLDGGPGNPVWSSRVEYRTLGRTGVQVSPLCLGAMMFGPVLDPCPVHRLRGGPAPRRRSDPETGALGMVLTATSLIGNAVPRNRKATPRRPARILGHARRGRPKPPLRLPRGGGVPRPLRQRPLRLVVARPDRRARDRRCRRPLGARDLARRGVVRDSRLRPTYVQPTIAATDHSFPTPSATCRAKHLRFRGDVGLAP